MWRGAIKIYLIFPRCSAGLDQVRPQDRLGNACWASPEAGSTALALRAPRRDQLVRVEALAALGLVRLERIPVGSSIDQAETQMDAHVARMLHGTARRGGGAHKSAGQKRAVRCLVNRWLRVRVPSPALGSVVPRLMLGIPVSAEALFVSGEPFTLGPADAGHFLDEGVERS